MKLKKLLNVMVMSQPIKFVTTNGRVTTRSQVVSLADKFDRALIESLEEFKVHSIRHVHNDFEKPDYQDYIEITLIGGNYND